MTPSAGSSNSVVDLSVYARRGLLVHRGRRHGARGGPDGARLIRRGRRRACAATAAGMEAQPDVRVLAALRRKVASQLESHQYESAVFLADKLVSMSNGTEDVSANIPVPLGGAPHAGNIAASAQDVYTLAQAYYRAGMHQRAIFAIVEAGLLERQKFRCSRRPLVPILCAAR